MPHSARDDEAPSSPVGGALIRTEVVAATAQATVLTPREAVLPPHEAVLEIEAGD